MENYCLDLFCPLKTKSHCGNGSFLVTLLIGIGAPPKVKCRVAYKCDLLLRPIRSSNAPSTLILSERCCGGSVGPSNDSFTKTALKRCQRC